MAYLPPGLALPVLGTFLSAFARSSFATALLSYRQEGHRRVGTMIALAILISPVALFGLAKFHDRDLEPEEHNAALATHDDAP